MIWGGKSSVYMTGQRGEKRPFLFLVLFFVCIHGKVTESPPRPQPAAVRLFAYLDTSGPVYAAALSAAQVHSNAGL